MINFIPIFPLALVVYPGENLNLHIFEERYKQLINECNSQKKNFGIPSVINDNIGEFGTLVRVKNIATVYPDGRMDITVEGLNVFKVLEVIKDVPDKLYSGAIVNYPENEIMLRAGMMNNILSNIRELHRLLKVTKDLKKPDEQLLSYDVAHHAGLNLEEEYELLGLLREDQRLEYLKRHLKKLLPLAGGIESLKERIQMNGHFKELKGFNLDL
ncbi:MAG TPA: LON peptidase substrate-binding domain-containing protein [Panacibacter sp.]|nr:LON peptidase substrate-binding domain-containing protein [Panacibacter sp.]HNP42697.1 LON peptidase substrate-binding domain-containing protein [Panacibacter sp.]